MEEYQFSYRGLTFGLGTNVRVPSIEGLEDLAIRSGAVEVPRGDGDIPGLFAAAGKDITLELIVRGQAHSHVLTQLRQDVLAAFTKTQEPSPLAFKEPGMPERFVYANVLDRSVPRDPRTGQGFKSISVRMHASDPRIYSAELHTLQLGIYSASGGGTDFEKEYDVDFVVDRSSDYVVRNAGDAPAYPLLRFYGPADAGEVEGVKITNLTTGQVNEWELDILSGQILTADMRRIVSVEQGPYPFIHLDGTNRWGTWKLPRKPFELAPGDNILRYEIEGTSNDAPCVIAWRDTWL